MLELFILIAITKRITPLATERGLSPLKWILSTFGAWIGGQITVGLTIGVTLGMIAAFYDISDQSMNILMVLLYATSLAGAFISVSYVEKFLKSKPKLSEIQEKQKYIFPVENS
ncbi:MAG: hypothetical protein HY819_10725 [Acidobacteria bacterium]|nr:hypothetical protein [Acidobacteriota bacterium]